MIGAPSERAEDIQGLVERQRQSRGRLGELIDAAVRSVYTDEAGIEDDDVGMPGGPLRGKLISRLAASTNS